MKTFMKATKNSAAGEKGRSSADNAQKLRFLFEKW
jgi:hypothetical protein